MTIAPKKENGKIDWFGYLRTTWPIIVTLLMGMLWANNRLESPQEKEQRIRYICTELIMQRVPPEKVTIRLDRLEADVKEIKSDLKSLIRNSQE